LKKTSVAVSKDRPSETAAAFYFNREPHEPRENFLTRIARITANSKALKALRKLAQGWRAATTLGNRPTK
jgi:hypothetical protein